MTWEEQNLLINKVARKYTPAIFRAIKAMRQEALKLYQEGREGEMQNQFFDAAIHSAIAGIYLQAGMSMAKYIYRSMPKVKDLQQKRAIGQMGISEEWLAVVKVFLEKYGLRVTNIIVSTQRKKIIAMFQHAAEKGWGYNYLAEQLMKTGLIKGNAEAIARTEAHRAAMVGSITGAKSLPYECQKEWLSGRDLRTRSLTRGNDFEHYLTNGQIREMHEYFDTKTPTMQPGDPETDPGNTIRCRCVLNYIPKRDERGMLILK